MKNALKKMELTGTHTVGQHLLVGENGRAYGCGPTCLHCGKPISLPYEKDATDSFPCPECGITVDWSERYRPLMIIFDDGERFLLPPEIEKISDKIQDWNFLRETITL